MTNDPQNTYQQALDFLLSYVDFSLTHQERIAPERFELERMVNLLDLLGNPHHSFPAIHIAGTKGKGSVSAHCAAALKAAGYRTGLYTSPHLHDFRERIQVNGEPISTEDFVNQTEKLKTVTDKLPGITSYELQTALAFLHFAAMHVECAVVEVGMGGRLDSTNVLTPLVSVITNISLDHTAILGNTLSEIAGEKGGIIKPYVPVVSSPQHPEALEKLRSIAANEKANFTLVGEDLLVKAVSHTLEQQTFQLWWAGEEDQPKQFSTRLLGQHQIENAATAYAALQACAPARITVSDEAVAKGFAQVDWPGRFEIYNGTPPVVFDGAHNRHSAKVLHETMQTYFPQQPIVLVFGASEDKDIAGMFAELLPHTQALLFAQAKHPRAASEEKLQQLASQYDCEIISAPEIEDVFPAAMQKAGAEGVILVTGSLYLVGQMRTLWLQKMAEYRYNTSNPPTERNP